MSLKTKRRKPTRLRHREEFDCYGRIIRYSRSENARRRLLQKLAVAKLHLEVEFSRRSIISMMDPHSAPVEGKPIISGSLNTTRHQSVKAALPKQSGFPVSRLDEFPSAELED